MNDCHERLTVLCHENSSHVGDWRQSCSHTQDGKECCMAMELHVLIKAKMWRWLPRLPKIAKLVLTIPYFNAAEERVFSMIQKNKTFLRSNLSLDKALYHPPYHQISN